MQLFVAENSFGGLLVVVEPLSGKYHFDHPEEIYIYGGQKLTMFNLEISADSWIEEVRWFSRAGGVAGADCGEGGCRDCQQLEGGCCWPQKTDRQNRRLVSCCWGLRLNGWGCCTDVMATVRTVQTIVVGGAGETGRRREKW